MRVLSDDVSYTYRSRSSWVSILLVDWLEGASSSVQHPIQGLPCALWMSPQGVFTWQIPLWRKLTYYLCLRSPTQLPLVGALQPNVNFQPNVTSSGDCMKTRSSEIARRSIWQWLSARRRGIPLSYFWGETRRM